MKQLFKTVFAICAVALIGGCSTLPTQSPLEITDSSMSSPTETEVIQATITEAPEPTHTPTLAPVVLYREDFEDVNSGWERYNEYDGVLDYENGQYHMRVNAINNLFWVQAAFPEVLDNSAVQVTTTWLESQLDAPYGVICRLDTNYQYYYFYITGDGHYGIGKHLTLSDLQEIVLADDGGTPNDVIQQGQNAQNTILAVCNGDQLLLSVNGVSLLQAQDDQLGEGVLGLMAGGRQTPGIDVFFDEFIVMQP